jgi:hypothetical protein
MTTEPRKVGGSAGNRGKGRKKGVPNKTTAALKEAILNAAAEVGSDGEGADGLTGYLVHIARNDIKAMAGLLGKVLPMQVAGDPDAPLVHRIERIIVDPSAGDA